MMGIVCFMRWMYVYMTTLIKSENGGCIAGCRDSVLLKSLAESIAEVGIIGCMQYMHVVVKSMEICMHAWPGKCDW